MKFKILFLLMLSTLSGCSLLMPVELPNGPGETRSSLSPAEITWHAMNIIDMGQTLNIARRPDCYTEHNFLTRALIGEHPSTQSVIISSVAFSLVYRAASQFIEEHDHINEDGNHDTPWVLAKYSLNVLGLLTKGTTVFNNYKIGLKPFGSEC